MRMPAFFLRFIAYNGITLCTDNSGASGTHLSIKRIYKDFLFIQTLGKTTSTNLFCKNFVVVVVWSGTQTQSGPAQIKVRAEDLTFYHPGLLRCPD